MSPRKETPRPVPDNPEEIAGWRMAPQPTDRPGRLAGLAELFEYLPRITHVLRPYWNFLLLSVVMLLLAVAAGLLMPWPMAILIDSVLGNQPLPSVLGSLVQPIADNRVALLAAVVAAEVAIKLLANLLSFIQTFAETKLELQVDFDFRSQLFRHAQRLSLPFHETASSGGLAVGLTYESQAAGSVVLDLLPMVQSLLTLVGMVWISFQLDQALTLLSLLVVPFLYYSLSYYSRHIRKTLVEVRGMAGQSIVLINEALRMLRVIVAFVREEHEYGRFRHLGLLLVDLNTGVAVREAILSIAVNMTTAIGTSLVLGLGAYHVLNKQISTGELLLLLSYIASVYSPLETISTKIGFLQNRYLSLQLGFHILDTRPEIADGPGAREMERAHGAVRFEGVSFAYPGRQGTLQEVSFEAQPGQVIAVVGPTGAGKTTLLSLLPRFYDPSQGRIFLDGSELQALTLRSLRSQIAVVLQEPLLFSGTLRDNIRYGRLEATEEEIVAAAQAANAHEFIQRLPQGYDTAVGEKGARLSGGERQRICIARAFVKDAPILILDEPTTSIDSKTESVILDALDRLMIGRTTFMIAHRLSSVRHADLILVLNHGQLVEKGTHDELLQHNGLYKQLHEIQVGQARRPRRRLLAPETLAAPAHSDQAETLVQPLPPFTEPEQLPLAVPMEPPETAPACAEASTWHPMTPRVARQIDGQKKIVLLGTMSRHPDPGAVWQTLHYLIGFQRLGYRAYYVEAHDVTPSRHILDTSEDNGRQAASSIRQIMGRYDLGDRWALQTLRPDGQCYGMSEQELMELYESAELIVNLNGETAPQPEHYRTGRLVYLETDPVELEIELYEHRQSTIDLLAPHVAFFTYAENYGRLDCRLPVSDRFHFKPTRQPVVLDWWQGQPMRRSNPFTTIGNWRRKSRPIVFQGETYTRSKHYEFLKVLDLPARTHQLFELALSNYTKGDLRLLQARGWQVLPAEFLSDDIDTYRNYILGSRGEFSVAKDQNVRLCTGWFSHRSATYLAAGRPVITQETGFSNILPIGEGLFAFSSMEDILRAVDAVNADYARHSRAATEIAREYFSAEVVLSQLLSETGIGPARARHASAPSLLPLPAVLGQPLAPMDCRVRIEANLPTEFPAEVVIELGCAIENLGRAELATVDPFPVHISSKWLDPKTGLRIPGNEGIRTRIQEPLHPGESRTFRVQVQAPATAGNYILVLTLVQERVAWFDDLFPTNVCSGAVRIISLPTADSPLELACTPEVVQ